MINTCRRHNELRSRGRRPWQQSSRRERPRRARHPHVVPLREIFDGPDQFALVMPLVTVLVLLPVMLCLGRAAAVAG